MTNSTSLQHILETRAPYCRAPHDLDMSLKAFPNHVGFNPEKIGKILGGGSEGDVYEYEDCKAIKFCLDKDLVFNCMDEMFIILRTLKYSDLDCVAQIFQYGSFGVGKASMLYYVMERLYYTVSYYDEKLSEFTKQADEAVSKIGLYYEDFCVQNVMYDADRNVKYIDHTSFVWSTREPLYNE